MSTNQDYIVVKRVKKVFGSSAPTLEEISFSVPRGEFICLFGPNGCGKTTMLSLLAGVDSDYQGEILINGPTPLQAKVGIVPQDSDDTLLPWRTIIENIALPLEFQKVKLEERERQVRNFMKQADITLPLGLYPHQISGGQKQLTAILQALLAQPEFLVLDEPFSALDYHHLSEVQNSLSRLGKLVSATIIFTTHDLLTAIHFADRILIMTPQPSRIFREYPISLPRPRIYRDPKLLAIYDEINHEYLLSGLEN